MSKIYMYKFEYQINNSFMGFLSYDMQLFTSDTTIFSKKGEKLPSKVAYFMIQVKNFRANNRPKTRRNLNFCSITIAHFTTNE